MTRRHVEIEYAVETKGPLHVGTGHGAAGLQRAMLRDRHGLPYIPGSTIKGRARFAAIRICDWMGLKVLKDAVGDERAAAGGSPNGPRGKSDLPARIFGSAWSRCTLRFDDARAEPPPVDPSLKPHEIRALQGRAHGLREVRTGAARSRLLGTISHRRLYQTDVAPPGVVLRGQIHGHLECDDIESAADFPVEILVLWLALHLMVEDGVGGSKSAGNGKLAWAEPGRITMKVDGAPFNPTNDDASAVLGLLTATERAGADA